MPKMIFVNLPVTDLKRATAFYEAIGATKNPQFSDDTASCMVFSETIYAMLLTHEKWGQFTSKKIVDARTSSEVMIALSADSREDVDGMVGKAKAAGGSPDPTPTQDFGLVVAIDDEGNRVVELVHGTGLHGVELDAAKLELDDFHRAGRAARAVGLHNPDIVHARIRDERHVEADRLLGFLAEPEKRDDF